MRPAVFESLGGTPLAGRLVYHCKEHSFDVEPRSESGIASLLVNDVQIEIDENGYLLYIWGFCPHESWKPKHLTAPASSPGRLRCVYTPVVAGISKRIHASKPWSINYDASSGWLCIGDMHARDEMIAFAPGAVASLADGHLIAIWLHPTIRA
jgi:hypothetical protein